MMMEELPLSPAINWRGFFNQVQLHGELADLAFKRRNVGLVLGNDAGLGVGSGWGRNDTLSVSANHRRWV